MNLIEIKNETKALKNVTDVIAYEKGFMLLQELKQYKETISPKEYKSIENKIQEQRFR